MATLRQSDSDGARALEFTILTGGRASEVVNAVWSEFDEGLTVWTIPAERMKMDREHQVPLSPASSLSSKACKARTQAFRVPGR